MVIIPFRQTAVTAGLNSISPVCPWACCPHACKNKSEKGDISVIVRVWCVTQNDLLRSKNRSTKNMSRHLAYVLLFIERVQWNIKIKLWEENLKKQNEIIFIPCYRDFSGFFDILDGAVYNYSIVPFPNNSKSSHFLEMNIRVSYPDYPATQRTTRLSDSADRSLMSFFFDVWCGMGSRPVMTRASMMLNGISRQAVDADSKLNRE